MPLGEQLELTMDAEAFEPQGEVEIPVVDTGENGVFTKGEFEVITSVGRLKGIAMKMGQIMSYIDMAMPDELRDALAVLQTHAQPMTFEQVRAIVTAELGDAAPALLEHMEPTPISAASIGQVHRARLPDGTPVAVKIQYPEIDYVVRADLKNLRRVMKSLFAMFSETDFEPLWLEEWLPSVFFEEYILDVELWKWLALAMLVLQLLLGVGAARCARCRGHHVSGPES